MIRLFLAFFFLSAATVPIYQARGAAASEFNSEQRAEILAIIREALKHDPSILRDAIIASEEREHARRQAEQHAVLAEHRSELVTPADPVAGSLTGDVTIVEFFDTRCLYCRSLQ